MHICTSYKEIDRVYIIIYHYKHDSWLKKIIKKGVKSLINLTYIWIKNVPAHYESTHKEDNVDNYGD